MTRSHSAAGQVFFTFGCVLGLATLAGCGITDAQDKNAARKAVSVSPDEGNIVWFQPSAPDDVGEGSVINLKIDRTFVPYSSMFVATQTLAASGIPVHAHKFEDEILYVVKGTGKAVIGEDREEVHLEPGSVVYVPIGEWHGVLNDDPNDRMELLIVTTPEKPGGLADFFRNASSKPGHPPLNLPEDELLAMFDEYGMKLPEN